MPRRQIPMGGSVELPGAPGALGPVTSVPRGSSPAGRRGRGGGSVELPGAPGVLASVPHVATVAPGNRWWIRPTGSADGPSRLHAPRAAPWLDDLRGARPAFAGVRFLALFSIGAPWAVAGWGSILGFPGPRYRRRGQPLVPVFLLGNRGPHPLPSTGKAPALLPGPCGRPRRDRLLPGWGPRGGWLPRGGKQTFCLLNVGSSSLSGFSLGDRLGPFLGLKVRWPGRSGLPGVEHQFFAGEAGSRRSWAGPGWVLSEGVHLPAGQGAPPRGCPQWPGSPLGWPACPRIA